MKCNVVFQESGVGAIGLGGKSTWNVDEEITELVEEKSTKKPVTKPVQQHSAGRNVEGDPGPKYYA